jgi:hypothetical protein
VIPAGSFLSLRRGERWLGEAETEWGKAILKRQAADNERASCPISS